MGQWGKWTKHGQLNNSNSNTLLHQFQKKMIIGDEDATKLDLMIDSIIIIKTKFKNSNNTFLIH